MKFDRRISRRSFLAAAGVTSAALALTACGGSSSSTAASSAAGGASSAAAGTAQGGTLNIMLETEVQSLDPQVATDGTSFEVIADYTDGLMQMDADGAAVPGNRSYSGCRASRGTRRTGSPSAPGKETDIPSVAAAAFPAPADYR